MSAMMNSGRIFAPCKNSSREPKTLAEKQRQLAISKQIIMAANATIDEFRRRIPRRS
jgi:hypothetical protein